LPRGPPAGSHLLSLITEVLQGHSVQHVRDGGRHLLPEAPGHAAFGPAASGLAARDDTVDQGNGALRRPDDVAHSDLGRGPRQAVSPGGAFYPLDQPGPLQFAEQLGDVGGRDALAAGMSARGTALSPPWRARSTIARTAYRPWVESLIAILL
jgi:hypothetical protein